MGIHPWDAEKITAESIEMLKERSADPQVIAIGEAGLDALKGGDMARQIELFKCHAAISEALKKPLIIHAVKTFQQIISLHDSLRPALPWIIHGFRGKAPLAVQLFKHGFYLSLGEKFNPEAAAALPAACLFVETDESLLPIQEIARRVKNCNPAFDINNLPLFKNVE